MTIASDLFALIEDSHERVESLLDSLIRRWARASPSTRPQDRVLLDRVRQALAEQLRAEERILYRRLVRSAGEEPAVQDALAQHRELERRLREIEEAEEPSERFLRKLRGLQWSAEIHFEHEENKVFETARDVIDRETAERLARDWERATAADG